MVDFTYTVFLIVTSLTGFCVTVFAAGVLGVLLYDAEHTSEPLERAELQRAA